jgi:diguanylate cyclase (GGDEF)-like protein/PAS domain S-box-containing protein
MDVATVMLMLAVGSFLFGLLLVVLKFNVNNRPGVPFWTLAKFSQAVGSLLLYQRVQTYDGLTVLAHVALALGCAYEAWAVRILTGHRVQSRLHLLTAAGIVAVILSTAPMALPYPRGVVFLIQSIFYFLPGAFLLRKHAGRSLMQIVLGVCYLIAASVFFIASVVCLVFPQYALGAARSPVFGVVPLVSFCIFMVSGYILLMLAKERSDLLVAEMRKSLQESQSQFQMVVETAIEGIVILDEDFRITFANEKMASSLGYTVEEMVGRDYQSFFPEDQRQLAAFQESKRRQGQDSVYECGLLGKDGQERWFLVSATAILDEQGKFVGSFAMLSDISERKAMELALEESNRRLTELSNTDSLTGIPNRRSFDAVLEREYSRLQRTRSKLSVIMLDLDHFKAYNDRYGHVSGDNCLRQVGAVLAECVGRSVDLAARYGGEEFACILPDTDLAGSVRVAERIKQRIEDLKIEHKDSPVSPYMTASFGVITVEYCRDLSPEDVVHLADQLLYKAKAAGRNRIVSAQWVDEGQAGTALI